VTHAAFLNASVAHLTEGPHSAQRKYLNPAAGGSMGINSPEDPTVEFVKSPGSGQSGASESPLSGHAKLVVAALFGVPVVLFALIMTVTRCRRRGQRRRFLLHNLNEGTGHKTSLGALLGDSRKRAGFEPLSTEDMDEDSDSDVEEFIAKIKART